MQESDFVTVDSLYISYTVIQQVNNFCYVGGDEVRSIKKCVQFCSPFVLRKKIYIYIYIII